MSWVITRDIVIWEGERFILTDMIREEFLVHIKFELNRKNQEGLQKIKVVGRGEVLEVVPVK